MQGRPRRSVLYMPGSNERALEKAKIIAADALIFDLEDAVAPDAKPLARDQVCAAVKNGLCDHGLVTVRMPGGTLSIEVRPDWSIRLQGPVEEVYTGVFSRDLMDALTALVQ